MQCQFHPARTAQHFCEGCGKPLCSECSQMILRGSDFYCFQCAILQSVSVFEGPEKGAETEAAPDSALGARRGPFEYFIAVAAVLTLVMWGVIFFGGLEPPPGRRDFICNDRVLFFVTDNAVKRYARYEGRGYPEDLADLVPRYLPLKKGDMGCLEKLAYRKIPDKGYRLTLADPERVRAEVE